MPEAPIPETLAAPINREPPVAALEAPLTEAGTFFVRNNGCVPAVPRDADEAWSLSVEGLVRRPVSISPAALRRRFAVLEVTAVLECAGNGRAQFDPPTDGLPWGLGAVGCARWTGVRLADVLEEAGVLEGATYLGFESPDHEIGRPERAALSRGIPLAKALSPETLIAFAMNGRPLDALHGAPLRIVAPGFPGSAWQKWLSRILVLDHEHRGAKMTGTDYRMPRRPMRPGEALDAVPFDVITDMPVKSLITNLADGFEAQGALEVAGWAWSGHTPLARVEVSVDGGASWVAAALAPGEGPWAWRRFRAAGLTPRAGAVTVMARATDAAGVAQPLTPPWNPRGYLNNAVQRVTGRVMP
jgi:DMSO/TMAO reductase YedYZ molybdopterin-dependent catalytic subunit